MNKHRIYFGFLIMFSVFLFSTTFAFAHPHSGEILINDHSHSAQTEYIPLNGMMEIEKTTLFFHASDDNTLPWGFVEGKISNPVLDYPVIIQFFQDGDAAHFAQVNVANDGSYEYKFRVLNVNDGQSTKIFDGDYLVTIFKVVYLNQNNLL